MGKTIVVDTEAHTFLLEMKVILYEEGFDKPTHSDAVRRLKEVYFGIRVPTPPEEHNEIIERRV